MAKHSLYENLDKVVIIGGTFDPIHIGHLEIANHLLSIFNTKITFMPTSIPNYKPPPKASNVDRLNMLQLAIDGQSNFQIDTREIIATNYCPTHQTLSEIRNEIGSDIPLYFLIGSDSLQNLDSWDYWDKLPDITHFIITNRSGYNTTDITSSELKMLYNQCQRHEFEVHKNNGNFYILNFTPTDISSTTIRNKVKNHEDIKPYVTQSVASYIEKHHLYLS